MQQYDVQVEWQTVQHYLRRGASEMLLGRGGLAIPYQTQK